MNILKIKSINGNEITVENIKDKILLVEIIKDIDLFLSDNQYVIDEKVVTIFIICNIHDVDSNTEVCHYGLIAANKDEYLVKSEDLKFLPIAK